MIRLIDIRLNAAHPELPLCEAVTYTGAPSTVLIRGVPGNCGKWGITSVYVAATFPDGSTSTRMAVQSANGVWVATLPATNTSGRTASGLRIMADGIDENGELVTGYILGVADFAVASLGVAPAPEPGQTSYQMLYFDAVPSVLRKGDVVKIDGVLKFYNGSAWEPFADLSGYVPTSRTINNKALTDNVSLSGADIPVDATQGAQKIDAALAGKQDVLTFDSKPLIGSTSPVTSEGILSALTSSTVVNRDMRNLKVAGLPASGTGYFVFRTSDNFDWARAEWDSSRSIWSIGIAGMGILGLRTTANPEIYEAVHVHLRGTITHIQDLDFAISDTLSFLYNSVSYTVFGVTDDTLAKVSQLVGKLDKSGGTMTGALIVPVAEGLHFGNQFYTAAVQDIQGNKYLVLTDGTNSITIPIKGGTVALTAGTGHSGNLAALDASGNPVDAGYRFEVRNGIPYIIETTND